MTQDDLAAAAGVSTDLDANWSRAVGTPSYLCGAYWSGKYEELTGLIPQALIGLRALLHTANATTRAQAAEQLAWGYWVAGSTLIHLLQPDAAFMAIRRAIDLAGSGDDALLAAALKAR